MVSKSSGVKPTDAAPRRAKPEGLIHKQSPPPLICHLLAMDLQTDTTCNSYSVQHWTSCNNDLASTPLLDSVGCPKALPLLHTELHVILGPRAWENFRN